MTPDRVTSDLVSYRIGEMGGVRWALGTTVQPGKSTADAAGELFAALPGVRVETGDDALVDALVALGGRVQRRAHDYEYDLRRVPAAYADPALPGDVLLAPVDVSDAETLAPVHAAAVPPGHPDHKGDLDHVADLTKMLRGEMLGPLCAEASWHVRAGGAPLGAVVVVQRPAFGDMSARLWVIELFVSPRRHGQGLGKALLQRSLHGAAQAGHALMGLVVTDGNPARRLYESVGFTLVASGTNVDLPPR